MPKRKRQEPKPRELSEQSKLFIEKAREVGADEEGDVTEIMRRLASQGRRQQAELSKPRKPGKTGQ